MAEPDRTVGIVGGTGALGRGLAARWARAGVPVVIGSRDPQRAEERATELRERLGSGTASIGAGTNVEAASQDLVALCVPWEGLDALLSGLAGPTAGRIVICAVNPLAFDGSGPYAPEVDGGSVAEQVARALPDATVVGAFHTVSSHVLGRLDEPVEDDVPVVADDEDAATRVAALAGRIDGCRGVVVGPLRLAATLERLTPVLISVNKRAKAHVGVRFSRL